jgi:aryl-alcohol dehydrogenase-like predicted oxidoreductase
MRYKLFGRTGLRVSELCLGAMIFGDQRGPWGATPADAREIFTAFAEAGGNFIDTSNYYSQGNSERVVGDLIAADRDRWVLSTKYALNVRPDDPNAGGNHRKAMMQSLHGSLERLRTDYIDVYWVHVQDRFTPVEEVVRALDDLVAAGKVLYVGVSDTPAWQVSQAVTLADLRGWTRFAGLQVPYSLVERAAERDLLPMAQSLDLAVTAWSPLGDGVLSGKYGTGRPLPDDTRIAGIGAGFRLSERNLLIADAVNQIAAEHDASPAQVAIAWVRAQQARGVIIPIIGSRTPGQFNDNLGSLELQLSAADLGYLDEVSRIELGFPHDFGGNALAYGKTLDLIDGHRR